MEAQIKTSQSHRDKLRGMDYSPLNSQRTPGLAPTWYNEQSRPCSCQPKRVKILMQQPTLSDGLFTLKRCAVCQHSWSTYFEG